MKRFLLPLLLGAAAHPLGASAQNTNLNPALISYQAFLVGYNIPRDKQDYLTTNLWHGGQLPAAAGADQRFYDAEFKLLRQAAHCRVPADWGLDLSNGPELLLPHLARAKQVAVVDRARFAWDLQNGRPEAAREDWIATLALARNLANDGVLISALVQIAMENILLGTVAENCHQIPPATLRELASALDAAPARGTMATVIAGAEKESFCGWFIHRVEAERALHPGDEAAALAGVRQLLLNTMSTGDAPDAQSTVTGRVDEILAAAHGTTAGVLALLQPLTALYDRAAALAREPAAVFEARAADFQNEIRGATNNPFVGEFFPALSNCRRKEIAVLSRLAMLRAAAAYRAQGAAGLAAVPDPATGAPFKFERFLFQGVDRGFRLTSAYVPPGRPAFAASGAAPAAPAAPGYAETLIFVERPGAPFLVDGPHAGDAVPTAAATAK